MKNILLLTALTAISIFSQAQGGKVIDDKNAQKREIKGFHGIEISSGIDLYLTQSGDEAVAVSASSSSDRDRIRTEVENGVLKIYMNNDGFRWGARGDRKFLKAYVSCKMLDGLHASGGSDVFLQDLLKSERLDLGLSGGSDLKGKMNIGDLSINQTGGSDSYISGTAAQLSVHATGGSDFHGYDLECGQCHIDATGGSDVHITANKEISINATGGSDVSYKGSAVVKDQHSSGSSSISRKG
jgi:hypothetical protein